MPLELLIIATAGLFAAGVIKGATGLGYASCALPFLVVSLGLKPAMALVLAPAIATNVSLVVLSGHLLETFVRFRPLYLAMVPGIGFGLFLLVWVDQSVAIKVLGVVILSYVALGLFRPTLRLPERLHVTLQAPTGFMNGIFTGLTGSQVVPLVPYVMALDLDPRRTVQAINLAVMIATGLLALGLVVVGILTAELAAGSIAAIAPALAGVALGVRLREGVSVRQFRLLVYVVLFAIGVQMLVQ